MAAIQNYLMNEDSESAGDYMGVFSTLMRQILENSREEFITLKEEISMLERYLNLQQLRFAEKLDFEIVVDDRLDVNYTGIPPMFAQPFIENALEHGLFRKNGKNSVQVKFSSVDDKTIGLEILDTGVGVSETNEESSHKSLAMTITKERLEAFTSKDFLSAFKTENLRGREGSIDGYRISLKLPSKLMNAA